MPILILARHGRTAANQSGVLAGRSRGVHLDETGIEQAERTAARIAGVRLAAAVTSPMERCRETAKILTKGLDVKVGTDKRLTECDYGEWTGRSLKDLAKEPMWRTVQAQPSAARFPGGESLADMTARAVAAVRAHDAAVPEEHGDTAVWLAVSHADVIKAVLADALGSHLDQFQRIVVDPASLSVVHYTPLRSFVLTMNSASGSLEHLNRPAPKRRGRKAGSDAVVGGGAGPGASPRGH